MLTPDTIYLIKKELHEDKIRQLQRWQLLQEAGLNNIQQNLPKKVAGWLGNRMVKWGAKLESYGTTTHSKAITLES